MSARFFQSVIVQMKEATDKTIGVIDADGNVVACNDLSMMGAEMEGAAAAVAVVAGIGLTVLLHTPEPEDTFTDPYLAYAAVEQAFSRMGETVSKSAEILSEKENEIDKVTYWK